MTFTWPLALLGLLLVPLALAGYVLLQRRRMRYAARFTNLDLLANVVERSPGWRRHVPAALLLLALSALLVGLARPQALIAVPKEEATVILTIDVSGSMEAKDVQPTRMAAARAAARTFVDGLPESSRVGLVTFSSEAQLLAPPTANRAAIRNAIESLAPGGGTALGDAIVRSLQSGLAAAREPGQNRAESGEEPGEEDGAPFAVLLLSDGANTLGAIQPLPAAARARRLGVPVYTIALGTPDGIVQVTDENGFTREIPVPPDFRTLEQIAERTGGEAFRAPTEEELRSVYEDIGDQVTQVEEERELTVAFAGAGELLMLVGAALSALWFNRLT
ncbi:MAG: VWA domain-containing protein [Actinobacteria bacterium]|nr:VWA domain-containing protein [Actinomycetota bacterium]